MRTIRAILFLTALLAARPSGAAPPSAVATVTSVHGAVQMKARGQAAWAPVTGTRALAEGTALRVGPGGRALLLQPGCPPRALAAGARWW